MHLQRWKALRRDLAIRPVEALSARRRVREDAEYVVRQLSSHM
jgi:hypothetical protein